MRTIRLLLLSTTVSLLACGTVSSPQGGGDDTEGNGNGIEDSDRGEDTFTPPVDTSPFVDTDDSGTDDSGTGDSGDSGDSSDSGFDTGFGGGPVADSDTADGCAPGEFVACDGDCSPLSWLGDGLCDDFLGLSCPATNWDDGDCPAIVDTDTDDGCSFGETPDCAGGCAPANWLGDGFCDDFAALACEATGWDGGDCLPVVDSDTDDGCPAGEFVACDGVTCRPNTWVGDGECDQSLGLYCAATGWDGGDCPLDTDSDGVVAENPCPSGQVPDCNGTCAAISDIGNGTCDAGFDCDAYGLDGGDCGTYNSCGAGRVPDCGTTGQTAAQCSPATWLEDQDCDSYLNCATFGFDAGDCSF